MNSKLPLHRFYLLPFDHRQSFRELLKLQGLLSQADLKKIKQYKQLIYAAFKQALAQGVDKRTAGILVDETYGKEILLDARTNGFVTGYTLEKSGSTEFQLEHSDYKKRLELFKPNFAKALVHVHPENKTVNLRQARRLASINNYLKQQHLSLVVEVLINSSQKSVNDNEPRRLRMLLQSLQQLQQAGVDPALWKLEGFSTKAAWEKIAYQVLNGNNRARILVLGRNESKAVVERWITAGAKVPTVIGLAIGRTVFQKPLQDYLKKKIALRQAIKQIKNNFLHFVKLFEQNKGD